MTYSDFATLIQRHASVGAVSHLDLSDAAGYLALINRGLKGFTRYAYSHIDLNQVFVVTSGTATYDVGPMFEPLKLSLSGVFLRNLDGRIGPASLNYVSTLDLTATGTPSLWCVSGDQQITLHPCGSATGYLVGYVEHATITASGTVDLPDHIIDVAALWVSMALRYPHMQGSDLFEQVLALDRFAASKLKGYRSANRARFESPITRKGYVEQYHI